MQLNGIVVLLAYQILTSITNKLQVKLITAAKGASSGASGASAADGTIGLPRTLAQTERLLSKLQTEYKGYSTPGYDHHQGYLAFSKALALFG